MDSPCKCGTNRVTEPARDAPARPVAAIATRIGRRSRVLEDHVTRTFPGARLTSVPGVADARGLHSASRRRCTGDRWSYAVLGAVACGTAARDPPAAARVRRAQLRSVGHPQQCRAHRHAPEPHAVRRPAGSPMFVKYRTSPRNPKTSLCTYCSPPPAENAQSLHEMVPAHASVQVRARSAPPPMVPNGRSWPFGHTPIKFST